MTDKIIGPYRVIEEIDSGGMAHVYRAEDRQGRFGIVALKVMRPEIAMGTEYQLRFRREAKIWSELDHKNIVPLLDYSVTDIEGAYVAMRYINGCSLHSLLADRGALPIDYALPIIKDILEAVAYAHKKKVVHRDIKPDNVLLDRNGKAYLTDWGIAKPLGATELTNTGARLGTPTYMAPEQIKGKKDVSARADIYALGVMIYEMLTGHPPFESDDAIVLSHAHCYEEPSPMKRRGAPFPESLQTLVMKCLEKEPKNRPRTVKTILKGIVKVEKERSRGGKSTKKKEAKEVTVDKSVVEVAQKTRASKRKSSISLVVAERRVRPLAAPKAPIAAFVRIAALILIAAIIAGFGAPSRVLDTMLGAVETLRTSIGRLFGDDVSAEAVELLHGGNPRLALLTFERDIQEEPKLQPRVVEICWREAHKAYHAGRLKRAELLATYCARLCPKNAETRFFIAKLLLLQRRPLDAGREYVRALGWVPNHELMDHLDRHKSLITELPIRERRLVASRYYRAARGLIFAGQADLARPYAAAAVRLEPSNQVYRRLLIPPPTAPPRRLR